MVAHQRVQKLNHFGYRWQFEKFPVFILLCPMFFEDNAIIGVRSIWRHPFLVFGG